MTGVQSNVDRSPVPGTADGFDAFFAAQFRPLVGLGYVLTGSRGVAEELAQDALLAAFADWDRVSQLDKPGAWVRRLVTNRAASASRRRRTESRWLPTLAAPIDHDGGLDLAADSEHLWALIRRLPRRQAQVITLRTLDRSTVGEIAGVLGISAESASTHLRRARQTLTRWMEEAAP